jgi:integrase
MSYDFQSGFAGSIRNMLEWRGLLGYSTAEYRKKLGGFDRFCTANYPDENILTQALAFAWCNDAKGNGGMLRASVMRGFGRYLLSAGQDAYVLPPSFFPHKKAALPHIFSHHELNNFFDATDRYPSARSSPIIEYTTPVIFRLQYACGMRPQEVRLLRRQDFDFKVGTIYISKGKHNKDRKLSVDSGTMGLCRNYDHIAEMVKPGRTYFFQSTSGGAYQGGWLTKLFQRCWDMSGNGDTHGTCTPYALRHNYAAQILMRWIEQGKDLDSMIPYLSAYMGHESFSSTYYYLHLLPERLSRMDFTSSSGVIPEVPYEENSQ